jgi:hypothetical protein
MTVRTPPPIDKAKLFEKLGYEPHSDAQWSYHNSTAVYRVACCGRRWGKTTATGHDLTAYAFTPEGYYWIVGPTYKLGEKEFRVVYKDLEQLGVLNKSKKSYNVTQGNMRIETPWHCVIEVVSAERPESLLGEGLDGAVMSEAAEHNGNTWTEYIEPALSDKEGWADFPSTPEGFNWYKSLYEFAKHAFNDDWQAWRFPTWTNAAKFPGGFDPRYHNENTDQLPPEVAHPGCTCNKRLLSIFYRASIQHWLQEYGADFTAVEGRIYPEFDDNVHVREITYNPAWQNYWALDYGFTDPFVCLDIMVDPSNNVYVWREYQERFKATYDHGTILKNRPNPDGFHVDAYYGDVRGPDEAATLAKHGMFIESEDVGRELGYEEIRRLLKVKPDGKPSIFFDPSCTETIRQMQNLRRPKVKEDKNAKSSSKRASEGQHDYDDHGPDALRYFGNMRFVLGYGASLDDVYPGDNPDDESPFRLDTRVTLDSEVHYAAFGS